MNTNTTLASTSLNKKTKTLTLINSINKFIEKEKVNSIGITLVYIMVGTGLGSISAAMSALHNTVNLFVLSLSVCLAMATNAAVLSQQSFKITTWLFIINVIANVLMLIYLISTLF